MADVEFGNLRDGGDGDHVIERQAMPCVRFDAVLGAQRCRIRQAAQFDAIGITMRVFARVQLDHRRTQAQRRVDLARVGFDKQADPYPRVEQLRNQRREVVVLSRRVEATLCRALLAPFGNDARGMRSVATCVRSPV